MKRERSSGVVVYKREKNRVLYLLVKSKKNGHWGFPKGHIEERETELDAALREVLEEIGLEVDVNDDFKTMISYVLPNGTQKDVIYFSAEVDATSNVRVQVVEISDAKWLPYEAAHDLITHRDAKVVLEEVYDFIARI